MRQWFLAMVLVVAGCMSSGYVHLDGEGTKDESLEFSIRSVTDCKHNIPFFDSKILEIGAYGSSGFYGVKLDSNGDSLVDVMALIRPHEENPLFWMVDKDLDGIVDLVYIDPYGIGTCDNISLYCARNACPGRGPFDWKTNHER
jgi:hypothetical protein